MSKAGQARDAQALSSLQQALTFAVLVKTESGGPEQIQVLGGGGAAFLVASSGSDSYLAIWDDGNGTPMYYRGAQPPPFSAQRPAGGGWSDRPLS